MPKNRKSIISDTQIVLTTYRRSGFEMRIASFSGARNQKNCRVQFEHILLHGTGSTVAIVRFAI